MKLSFLKSDLPHVVGNLEKLLVTMQMVRLLIWQLINCDLALYSGQLSGDLPLGPGTIFLPQENSTLWKGQFMAAKSDGNTQWSFGTFQSWSLKKIKVFLESIEWITFRESQLQQTMDNFQISHFFKNGEKRIIDDSYGQIFLDGFSIYHGNSYAFEYNYGWKLYL